MDLSLPILDKEGKQIEARVNSLDDKGENEISIKKFTFKDSLTQALLKDEEKYEEEEVMKRFDLFLKIRDAEQMDFSEEEATFLKGLMLEKFDTLTCGQVFKHF